MGFPFGKKAVALPYATDVPPSANDGKNALVPVGTTAEFPKRDISASPGYYKLDDRAYTVRGCERAQPGTTNKGEAP